MMPQLRVHHSYERLIVWYVFIGLQSLLGLENTTCLYNLSSFVNLQIILTKLQNLQYRGKHESFLFLVISKSNSVTYRIMKKCGMSNVCSRCFIQCISTGYVVSRQRLSINLKKKDKNSECYSNQHELNYKHLLSCLDVRVL